MPIVGGEKAVENSAMVVGLNLVKIVGGLKFIFLAWEYMD